ncbi:hypothetical protein O181_058970 [Austropuccinia psidii MF-1]|uniref:N-acetyltransferase domain-containing protein n=1 Tax=Austropuccinia psidii MF-1 TaxID=1389203 RepID=A0A9Q3EAN9_9BASI|nr:hypothetical protein [Austropuccinia psidii MF-1]
MSLLRPFKANDLFKFNHVNLDPYTETYSVSYYLQYICTWPNLINLAESPNGQVMGYVMGKMEGENEDWHGHVSAITISPSYRRLSLARGLMNLFEQASNQEFCYFVDLFVRVSNSLAISMYENFGYSVYQRISKYYSGGGIGDSLQEEDAFDMRKALSIDKNKKSIRDNGREVVVDRPSF